MAAADVEFECDQLHSANTKIEVSFGVFLFLGCQEFGGYFEIWGP